MGRKAEEERMVELFATTATRPGARMGDARRADELPDMA